MAGAEEAKGCTHMSDIKPAIAILKEFINQRALAVDLLRVMQTLEDAPAEAARATKRVAALRKEMADLEDEVLQHSAHQRVQDCSLAVPVDEVQQDTPFVHRHVERVVYFGAQAASLVTTIIRRRAVASR